MKHYPTLSQLGEAYFNGVSEGKVGKYGKILTTTHRMLFYGTIPLLTELSPDIYLFHLHSDYSESEQTMLESVFRGMTQNLYLGVYRTRYYLYTNGHNILNYKVEGPRVKVEDRTNYIVLRGPNTEDPKFETGIDHGLDIIHYPAWLYDDPYREENYHLFVESINPETGEVSNPERFISIPPIRRMTEYSGTKAHEVNIPGVPWYNVKILAATIPEEYRVFALTSSIREVFKFDGTWKRYSPEERELFFQALDEESKLLTILSN